MGDPERDYYEEARQIIGLPELAKPVERGHVVAMQNELNQLSQVVALLNRVVVMLMLEKHQPRLTVPASAVEMIERKGLDVSVERTPRGDVVANLLRPSEQTAPKLVVI